MNVLLVYLQKHGGSGESSEGNDTWTFLGDKKTPWGTVLKISKEYNVLFHILMKFQDVTQEVSQQINTNCCCSNISF